MSLNSFLLSYIYLGISLEMPVFWTFSLLFVKTSKQEGEGGYSKNALMCVFKKEWLQGERGASIPDSRAINTEKNKQM